MQVGVGGGRGREADSLVSEEPTDTGLDPMILRSLPELKPRVGVGCVTEPPRCPKNKILKNKI